MGAEAESHADPLTKSDVGQAMLADEGFIYCDGDGLRFTLPQWGNCCSAGARNDGPARSLGFTTHLATAASEDLAGVALLFGLLFAALCVGGW